MSGSALVRRGTRLAAVCVPWFFALACSPTEDQVVTLQPLYCRADCEHCDVSASKLIDILPMPPPRERRLPADRNAVRTHRHQAVVEVRSHEGIPAANARVELWRHRRNAKPMLDGTAQTDVDGIASIPFDGRGVFCVHAVHPDVGTAARPARQLRLSNTPQDWIVELVLPQGDVVLQRAGVVQIGVAAPDGSPLALSRVAVWRHEFGAEEPALAGTGLTDDHGVVRIELDRPALYAVAAAHADFASDSLDYAWYVPRSPRGEQRSAANDDDPRFVECDAHLRLGADLPGGLRFPFHEHHLGPDDDLQVTDAPTCCRTWSRPEAETARLDSLRASSARSHVALNTAASRKHADPPAVSRPTDDFPPPFSSGTTSRRALPSDSSLDGSEHAAVRHR